MFGVLLASCSGDELTLPVERAPAQLQIVSGDRQQGLAGTLLIHAVAQWEAALAGHGRARARGRQRLPVLAADLVDTLVAVLTAPVSAPTRATLAGS